MEEFKYVIQDEQGIHARPAGILVKAAGTFKSDIRLKKDGKEGDLKRIFSVMSLCIKKGDAITVTAEGEDAPEAIEKLEKLFRENL